MRWTAVCALIAVAAASVSDAQGGLFQRIYRGLDLLATPSGSPLISTADGTRTNGERSGRLRILPDRFGKGYTLEFDRGFGADSRGRPEVLDLGIFEVELRGPTQTTLGYTGRLMLIGNANTTINNLTYALRFKTGLQDVELTGTLNVQSALEANILGFYTLSLNVNNTESQLSADGLAINDETDTAFDIGPLNIKGNIFFDGFVAALAAAGVDTRLLEQLTPRSPIDILADELREEVLGLPVVRSLEISRDGQLPPAPLDLTFGGSSVDASQAGRSSGAAQAPVTLVPEPSALMLISLGGALLWGRRRY